MDVFRNTYSKTNTWRNTWRNTRINTVGLGARRFLGEHVEELLGGRRNATQSFHEHQPRYGFLDPPRVVVLRPHPLPARIRLDPPLSIRVVFDPSLSSRVIERSVHLTATLRSTPRPPVNALSSVFPNP